MEQVERVRNEIEDWSRLALASSIVGQICTMPQAQEQAFGSLLSVGPHPGPRWVSAIVGQDGTIIAQGLRPADGRFLGIAREAVLTLTDEVRQMRLYARYVAEEVANGMLPMAFEAWAWTQMVESRR